MVNKYFNKLIIDFKKNFNLNIESLKFIIQELVYLGINNIEFDLGNNVDIDKLCEIIYFIQNKYNLNNIGIITDGFGIYSKIDNLKLCGINNISIRLESLKQYKYKRLNHDININEVLMLINKCINYKVYTKIIYTLINNFNTDEIFDFINLTYNLPIEVCFTELIPDTSHMNFYKEGYVSVLDVVNNIDNISKLNYSNGKIEYYKLYGAKGILSTNSHSNKCNSCTELFLDGNGIIKSCINSNLYFDSTNFINKPLMFKEELKKIL